mmetsp:Transcript_12111/g.34059  ORF Transcript_12111/g.34059 Transcript_12111/m.34059 type:complete len:656 (+) Transcript_12111:510-2477(+)
MRRLAPPQSGAARSRTGGMAFSASASAQRVITVFLLSALLLHQTEETRASPGSRLDIEYSSIGLLSSRAKEGKTASRRAHSPEQEGDPQSMKSLAEEVTQVWDIIHKDADEQQHELPKNISGMYRGTWSKIHQSSLLEPANILRKQDGVVIFELRTSPSAEKGLHSVEGDLVIRDGAYVTDNDVRMRMHGIYVPDAGRLNVMLEPLAPIRVDISDEDRTSGNSFYRQALREASKEWTVPGFRHVSLLNNGSPDAPLRLRKKCEFRIDLHPALVPAADQRAQPVSPTLPGSTKMTVSVPLDGGWREPSQSNPSNLNEMIMNGTLVSSNCGLVVAVNATYVRLEEYYAKAVNYTLMITIISFIQVLLLIRQMEATNTQASAAKVSLLSIGVQAIMDAYLCLLHLTAGIVVEALFNAFATAAFFEFVIFAIFEMRYLLSIWRARRASSTDGGGPRRELSIVYTRFYGALLMVIFFAYQLQRWLQNIIFLLYSFWIPQILHCVRADVRQPLRPMYILGISATRLALPLYLFGCPKNMLRISANPALCVGLVAWVGLQAAVLLLQGHFGPRCFIPKRFLPAKYDYFHPATPFGDGEHRSSDVETGEGSVECVICMTPVDVGRPAARMVTPCNHFFHSACLQRWMDVKMECPTCRRVLPPP